MRLRLLLVGGLALAMANTCDDAASAVAPDTCVLGLTMAIGTPVTGSTAAGDCKIQDHRGDSYQLTLAAQTTVKFMVSGQETIDIQISDTTRAAGSQTLVAYGNGNAYALFAVLPAGTYRVDFGVEEGDGYGDYTIGTAAITAPNPIGCLINNNAYMFGAVGIEVAGAITSNDCFGSQNQYYTDSYDVYLTAGKATKITVTASMGTSVELHSEAGATLAFHVSNTAGANVLNYTPTSTGVYHIGIIGTPTFATGTYTLKIE